MVDLESWVNRQIDERVSKKSEIQKDRPEIEVNRLKYRKLVKYVVTKKVDVQIDIDVDRKTKREVTRKTDDTKSVYHCHHLCSVPCIVAGTR